MRWVRHSEAHVGYGRPRRGDSQSTRNESGLWSVLDGVDVGRSPVSARECQPNNTRGAPVRCSAGALSRPAANVAVTSYRCASISEGPASATETCPRESRGRTVDAPMTHPHACLDCDRPGHLPQVHATGEMYGWLCDDCDRKRRRKQMGWKRRMKMRWRRLLQL